jgi:hypothetical protein
MLDLNPISTPHIRDLLISPPWRDSRGIFTRNVWRTKNERWRENGEKMREKERKLLWTVLVFQSLCARACKVTNRCSVTVTTNYTWIRVTVTRPFHFGSDSGIF